MKKLKCVNFYKLEHNQEIYKHSRNSVCEIYFNSYKIIGGDKEYIFTNDSYCEEFYELNSEEIEELLTVGHSGTFYMKRDDCEKAVEEYIIKKEKNRLEKEKLKKTEKPLRKRMSDEELYEKLKKIHERV